MLKKTTFHFKLKTMADWLRSSQSFDSESHAVKISWSAALKKTVSEEDFWSTIHTELLSPNLVLSLVSQESRASLEATRPQRRRGGHGGGHDQGPRRLVGWCQLGGGQRFQKWCVYLRNELKRSVVKLIFFLVCFITQFLPSFFTVVGFLVWLFCVVLLLCTRALRVIRRILGLRHSDTVFQSQM